MTELSSVKQFFLTLLTLVGYILTCENPAHAAGTPVSLRARLLGDAVKIDITLVHSKGTSKKITEKLSLQRSCDASNSFRTIKTFSPPQNRENYNDAVAGVRFCNYRVSVDRKAPRGHHVRFHSNPVHVKMPAVSDPSSPDPTPSPGGGSPSSPLPSNCPAGWLDQVFVSTNAQRAAFGLPALTVNPVLQHQAQHQSDIMAQNNRLDHGTWFQELWNVNYFPNATHGAQNIGWTLRGPVDIVQGWMASTEGHRENILDPKSDHIGLGCTVRIDPNLGQQFWVTQDFGNK